MRIALTLNGQRVEAEARADSTLLELLRTQFGLRSVRETCGVGVCGACTVLVDDRPASACILFAPLVDGREVATVEGLPADDSVVGAFVETHAFQCGFCTPGLVMSVKQLLAENPRPTTAEAVQALAGNLCRCGSYRQILEAVQRASELTAPTAT